MVCGESGARMFLRETTRNKDDKEHRYGSVVENRRASGGRVLQRHVLCLGGSTARNGSNGSLLYEIDSLGTTGEYAYVSGRNIAKAKRDNKACVTECTEGS